MSYTRKQYMAMISIYVKRREKIRKQYNYQNGSHEINFDYRRAVRFITPKLKYWRQAVTRIDQITRKLEEIDRTQLKHTGHFLRKATYYKKCQPGYPLTRLLFIKYCLENGFTSRQIREYLSIPGHAGLLTDWRRAFTRSLKDNIENRIAWQRFSLFMKQNYQPQTKTQKRA